MKSEQFELRSQMLSLTKKIKMR